MYERFYGLRANPFRLAPDTRFFYESSGHKRGLAYLRYGLQQGQGFVVVTGVPGTGKSLLVQTIFAELAGQPMVVASINNTNLEADDVLRAVANCFDVHCNAPTKAALLNALERFLIEKNRQGKRVLLIVDEAQNLPQGSLEELRMLSNFQCGNQPLLQIMLLGQQQLQTILADPDMEQLTQRVIASCHLKPLGAVDTRGYIGHRLRHVGWHGKPSFTGEALGLIYHTSQGIPRLINTFCDRLLLAACLEEKQEIDVAHVRLVLQELQNEATGAWRGGNPDALSATTLAPLPDGESLPADEPAAAVTEAPAAEAPAPAVAEPAVTEMPAPEPMRSFEGRFHTTEKKSTVVPITRASNPSGNSRVALSGRQVTALAQQAQVERREEAYVAVDADEAVPVAETQNEAISDNSADPGVVPAASVPPRIDADDQPPPLGHTTPDVTKTRRWWIAIGVVALVMIGVLLFIMFAGDGMNTGHIETAQPPRQTQSPVAQSESNAPESGSDNVSAESMPPGGGVTAEQGGATAENPAVEPGVAAQSAAAVPESGAEMKLPAVVPAKAAGLPEQQPGVKPAATPVPAAAGIEAPPPLRAPLPASAVKPSISETEIAALLENLAFAYESGDLNQIESLFAANAVADEGAGRRRIARGYGDLFQATDMRRMNIGALKWHLEGATAQGSGDFEVTVWRHGDDNPSTIKGRLNIEVVKAGKQLLISKLIHVVSR